MKKLITLLILSIVAGTMLNTANATTCAGAASIPGTPAFPYVTSLTCGTTDDINSANATACGNGSYLGGFEAVYAWTPAGSYIDVSFAYSGQTWTGVFLYQGCPTSGGICMANVTSPTSSKTLAFMGTNQTSGTTISLSAGVTYYLVIDTYPAPPSPCAGTLTINATLNAACTGTPAPGNTISTPGQACPGVSFTLSLQNSTPGLGVTYQWQSSPTGSNPWTNFGTSHPTQTVSQTTAKYYRCQVTCSGNTGTSNPLQVSMSPLYYCNCASMAEFSADEEIYSVTVGGNTNAYDCFTVAPGAGSILNQYSNFYPLGSLCNLTQSTNVPFTILENECDGPTYYSNGCAIWVDFNQDGDFTDAGEQVYSESTTTISPRTITGNIAVPGGATPGVTAMRITVAEDYSGADLTPCLSYYYGETEDYLVTVISSLTPSLLVDPTSLDFGTIVSGTTSAEMTYSLSGIHLTPSGGNITITPPANFEVSLTTGGPYSSAPINIGYTGGTLAASNIYSVFKPTASNNVYSGNIVNAGGGAANVDVAVSGSSYCDPLSLPLCESFSSDVWPSCWTEQLEGLMTSSHWSMASSNMAGGTAYEAHAYYAPAQGETQADNDRMVSPPFNTAGLTSVHLSFHQMLDDYNSGVNDVWIKVQSSSNGRTWTDEWVYDGGLGNSIPAEVKELDITDNLGGTTWLAWTLSGYSYDINNWYVDDVCIALPCASNTWAGTVSTDWNEPGNWTCGVIPDQAIIAVIPSNPSGGRFPVIASGIIAECYDVTLQTGATITVEPGGFLNIKNH